MNPSCGIRLNNRTARTATTQALAPLFSMRNNTEKPLRLSLRRSTNCCKIAITLIDPGLGVLSTMAWLQELPTK
jgi:hypothetical protein